MYKRIGLTLLTALLTLTGCSGISPAPSDPTVDNQPNQPPVWINEGQSTGEITVTIDPSQTFQTIKGFGTGSNWISFMLENHSDEDRDKIVDLCYGPEGIGLRIYRYIAGSGSNYTKVPGTGSNMCLEYEGRPGEYSLDNDPVGIAMLDRVMKYDPLELVVCFASPPAYLSINGTSNGNGMTSNLAPENYQAYAEFVCGITQFLVEQGYPITYVSPINEPQWGWGDGSTNAGEEGCHYELNEALEVCRTVIREILDKGYSFKASIPESAQWNHSSHSLTFLYNVMNDPILRDNMDHFAAHSYGNNATDKKFAMNYLAQYDFTIPMRQTEWATGETGMKGAVETARVIFEDLTILNGETWEYYAITGGPNYGLFNIQNGACEPNDALWAMANYSKFITGYTRVGCDFERIQLDDGADSQVVASAYVSPDGSKTAVVVVNEDLKDHTISFAGLEGKAAKVYRTDFQSHCEYVGDMSAAYGYELGFRTVTTFVFDN